MAKKIISVGVLLVMALSLFLLVGCNKSDFEFELINNGTEYKVKGYNGSDNELVIPDSHDGKPVTEMGSLWRTKGIKVKGGYNWPESSVESVVIPASIKKINRGAFSSCNNLKSVTFEENSQLEIIEEMAFWYCTGLENIDIPASVINIGDWAFANNLMKKITFASDSQLKTIGSQAFAMSGRLESIIIPVSVKTFGNAAFFNCMSLKSIYFESGSQLESLGGSPFHFSPVTDIYFSGTEEQWNILSTEYANIGPNITVHFNWSAE